MNNYTYYTSPDTQEKLQSRLGDIWKICKYTRWRLLDFLWNVKVIADFWEWIFPQELIETRQKEYCFLVYMVLQQNPETIISTLQHHIPINAWTMENRKAIKEAFCL